MYGVIMVMTMSIIGVGLKLVGTILIASLLIIPTITATMWSDRFHVVLLLAGFFGGLSAVVGTYFSTLYNGLSTGPTIIVVMTLFSMFSMVFGRKGMLRQAIERSKY